MKPILTVLCALLLALSAPLAMAQQQLVTDPEIYEKSHFNEQCKIAQYDSDFISRIDINNDGLTDAVVNEGAFSCDGARGPQCDGDGCPYNFYVQVKEGGYLLIATARIYSYEFMKRFGNMVFAFKMHPRFCDRTDSEPCEMIVRVRGVTFVTISKK